MSRKRVLQGLLIVMAVPLLVVGYFTAVRATKATPAVQASTLHPSYSREDCLKCHAPIAAEWRKSVHFSSVTGPFWEGIRQKGYADFFKTLRIPCMNCHAPANVLDLADGTNPVERAEAVGLGVDCVACHVSENGIHGTGLYQDAPHEVVADERFSNAVLASTTICARCHEEKAECGKTVTHWKASKFAAEGVTCLHCHMPEVEAPLVEGGPAKKRRSHVFFGDKDPDMLRKALNASLNVTAGVATVKIINDRVGHSLPASGQNSLWVNVKVYDHDEQLKAQVERSFGSSEWIPGYLDFWPFMKMTKIPPGETREVRVALPSEHGRVSVEFRYRDWFSVADRDIVFATIAKAY